MNCPKASHLGRLAAAVAACLASGCGYGEKPAPAPIGFVLNSRQSVSRLQHVVFIELDAEGDCEPGVAWDLSRAVCSAVQARRLFHVDLIRRGDPVCRDLPLGRSGAVALEEMARIREALQCDAVLMGSIQHFQPFPRMQLGMALKLMNLRDGELVWGVEHVWDTTDQATEHRIKDYFHDQVRSGYDPLGYELVLKSPRAFERFIAHEVASTLPARKPPAEDGGRVARDRPRAPAARTAAEKNSNHARNLLSSTGNSR